MENTLLIILFICVLVVGIAFDWVVLTRMNAIEKKLGMSKEALND